MLPIDSNKSKKVNLNSKCSLAERFSYNQRHPKPPSIPRSHSSKEFQQTCKPHVKPGRRILFRSYSSPNIGSTITDLKPPKPSQSFHLGDTRKNAGNFYNFKGQIATSKELPRVVKKGKTSLITKDNTRTPKTDTARKNFETIKNANTAERNGMIEETITELHGQTKDKPNIEEQRNLSSFKRHAVFFIDHDEGRLLSNTKLLPVLEELEPENETYDKSPWQFHDNESSISEVVECFHSNEKPAMTSDKSPWRYYGNEPRYHVVEELCESDDDAGLIIKNCSGLVGNQLDPIKKAMIGSWILDVTLKTSNKKIL